MSGKSRVDWQELLCVEQPAQPCVFVIFGASGDLARKKLFPALFALHRRGLLQPGTRIMGCARHEYDDESFRARLASALPDSDSEQVRRFLATATYCRIADYDEADGYARLSARLTEMDREAGAPLPYLFYFATPSNLYLKIVQGLSGSGLLREETPAIWRHVVLEKPFGFDLDSAKALDASLARHLREKQIYRIDHYLGKETVQNIFLLRFANIVFEPVWNRRYIENVQITVSETIGVENRAGYFDQAGILRDMFQNHMLEMLSLVAMECPSTFSADKVRDEKRKLIESIARFDLDATPQNVVRAQYDGYRGEPGVRPDSMTETYAAIRLFIDNMRWAGVPFYLRAGKKLAKRTSEIDVVFRHVPHSLFEGIRAQDMQQDILHLRVQPDEGVGLTLQAKKAGPKLCMGALTMNYCYEENEGEGALDAYSRLLLDCCLGDQTLFIRSDIIESAWNLYQPLLDCWRERPDKFPLARYRPGGMGPREADELLRMDGRSWAD